MKKTFRIVIVFALLLLIHTLVGCSNNLSGKYEAKFKEESLIKSKITYEFSDDQVTMTVIDYDLFNGNKTTTYSGTYEIINDEITFILDDYHLESVTYSFSKDKVDGEKVIIIDGNTYTKVK